MLNQEGANKMTGMKRQKATRVIAILSAVSLAFLPIVPIGFAEDIPVNQLDRRDVTVPVKAVTDVPSQPITAPAVIPPNPLMNTGGISKADNKADASEPVATEVEEPATEGDLTNEQLQEMIDQLLEQARILEEQAAARTERASDLSEQAAKMRQIAEQMIASAQEQARIAQSLTRQGQALLLAAEKEMALIMARERKTLAELAMYQKMKPSPRVLAMVAKLKIELSLIAKEKSAVARKISNAKSILRDAQKRQQATSAALAEGNRRLQAANKLAGQSASLYAHAQDLRTEAAAKVARAHELKSRLIPPAVQAFVDDFKARIGAGFKVTTFPQVDGTFLIYVTSTVAGDAGLDHIHFSLDASGNLLPESIVAAYRGGLAPDAPLLFESIRQIYSGATELEAAGFLSELEVERVDAEGAVYFVWRGAYYKCFRGEQGQVGTSRLIPPALQPLADQLPAWLGNVSMLAVRNTDGTYFLRVVNQNPPVEHMWMVMEFIVEADGVLRPNSLRRMGFEGIFVEDAQLLFEGMKLLQPGASDVETLGLMTQITVNNIDSIGAIHFTRGGVNYKCYHDANEKVFLEIKATSEQIALAKSILGTAVAYGVGEMSVPGEPQVILYYDADGNLIGRAEDTRGISGADGKESWYKGDALVSEIHQDGSEILYQTNGVGDFFVIYISSSGVIARFIYSNSHSPYLSCDVTPADGELFIQLIPARFEAAILDPAISTAWISRVLSRGLLNQDFLTNESLTLRHSTLYALSKRLDVIDRNSSSSEWNASALLLSEVVSFVRNPAWASNTSEQYDMLFEDAVFRHPGTSLVELWWNYLRDVGLNLEETQAQRLYVLSYIARQAKENPESWIADLFRGLLRETIQPIVVTDGQGEVIYTETDEHYQMRIQRVMEVWDEHGLAIIDSVGALYGLDLGCIDGLLEALSVFPPEIVRDSLDIVAAPPGQNWRGDRRMIWLGVDSWGTGQGEVGTKQWTVEDLNQVIGGLYHSYGHAAIQHEMGHLIDYPGIGPELAALWDAFWYASSDRADFSTDYAYSGGSREDFAEFVALIVEAPGGFRSPVGLEAMLAYGIERFGGGMTIYLEKLLFVLSQAYVGMVDGQPMLYCSSTDVQWIAGGAMNIINHSTEFSPVQLNELGLITEMTFSGERFNFVYDETGRLVSMTRQAVA